MKARESGMPDEEMWQGFFRPDEILHKLLLTENCGDVVDFGCGYGTFTIPAARIVRGTVFAVDIEPDMVKVTRRKVKAAGLKNMKVRLRDFVAEGTGLPDASVQYAMLFNILHAEEPLLLLREAHRVLEPGGLLGVMHWNYDPATPRGPSMDIRPRPEHCHAWAVEARFEPMPPGMIDLPPYHYGMVFKR